MGKAQIMYEPEFKKEMVRLHLSEGRTIASLCEEYGFAKSTYREWEKKYREKCQETEEAKTELDIFEENRRLKAELAESKKEIDFLKKAAAFFAKEIE